MGIIPDCPLIFLNCGLDPACLLSLMAVIRKGISEIAEEKGQDLKVYLHQNIISGVIKNTKYLVLVLSTWRIWGVNERSMMTDLVPRNEV